MIYKVGVLGASGRVGSEVASLCGLENYAAGKDWLELADAVTGSGKLVSIEGVDCRTLNDPERDKVHVWIDFSRQPQRDAGAAARLTCDVYGAP